MSDSFSRPLVAIDEQGQIAGDLQCLSCGYNLRGLRAEGVCPECGTPVGRSQYGNLLRYSNPDWVEQLASGMNWLVGAILLGFIGGIAVQFSTRARASVAMGSSGVWMAFAFFMTILNFIAYWKITTPDPSQQETSITARQTVRTLLIVSFAMNILTQLLILASFGHFGTMISGLSTVVGLVQTFATFTYAQQLAVRIPNPKLQSRTKLVMWGMAVCMALGALTAIMALVSPLALLPATSSPSTARIPAGGGAMVGIAFLGCFMGIGFLVFGIWSLLLIDRYRKALNEAAKQARSTWARDLAASANPQA